jgi:uracil-DNA glycosylase
MIRSFYTSVVNCPLTQKDCTLALKNFDTGDIPRGFSSRGRAHPDILVVRKNPGHAEEAEKEYYKGKRGRELFDAVRQFSGDRRAGRLQWSKGTGRFHINEQRYLLYILGRHKKLRPYKGLELKETEQQFLDQHVFFTNLFKCSTDDEQGRIPQQAFSVCYARYFLDELNLLRPRLILATGREAYRFLHAREKAGEIDVPVLYVKHPSYFYSKRDELSKLRELRRSALKILNKDKPRRMRRIGGGTTA